MPRVPVFYSFHFDNDVMRVQQVRNIGAIDDNAPVSANDWEQVKRGGSAAVQKWIDENMKYRRCVVVLIGAQTASRPWVKYEIQKAWSEHKGLLGVYIHNLKCPRNGKSAKGANPFEQVQLSNGTPLSSVVKCYDPNPNDAYGEISKNLEAWIQTAINQRA
jgi:hypothetical protein